jgi:hypothetical protein
VPRIEEPHRPAANLGSAVRVRRLRPLSEAECYARCYGSGSSEIVRVVRATPRRSYAHMSGEELRRLFELRLDLREPEAA